MDKEDFISELEKAIDKYGADAISISREEDGAICGMFSCYKNSFSVTKEYPEEMMDDEEIQDLADELSIGTVL